MIEKICREQDYPTTVKIQYSNDEYCPTKMCNKCNSLQPKNMKICVAPECVELYSKYLLLSKENNKKKSSKKITKYFTHFATTDQLLTHLQQKHSNDDDFIEIIRQKKRKTIKKS